MARILLAEDDSRIAFLVTTLLTQQGHEVIPAKNGSEALEALRTISEIDLLITDLLMPQMNGLVLLEKLQSMDRRIPIVALSAHKDLAHHARYYGATAFVSKPFKSQHLIEAVKSALSD
jgi:CheY-like chemotaxis protein